jgi:sugar phosphate isomerase/epimerase
MPNTRMSERQGRPGGARSLTRRQLLALSAAGAGHVVLARPLWASGANSREGTPQTSRRWGVQLYTVRNQIDADAAATLKRIAAIGYAELEVLQPTLSTVAPLVSTLGLTIVSVHLDQSTTRGEGFDAFVAQAKAHGLRYVVVPFVPAAERPTDRAGFDAVAARLSRMARAASDAGLQLCYHNHAFEFGKDREGTRWLDVLMQGTAASGMQLQLDVFWASVGGADPVALLRQYSGRIASLHLKDKDPRTATSVDEGTVPRTAFVEVGSGAIDFPAILAAARAAGVRHYFVEQDQTPGDPVESLRKSYAYLAGLR